MAEVTFFAADRLEDWSVEVREGMVLNLSAPDTLQICNFYHSYLLMKIQRASVPPPDGDVVHAGVLQHLEVHDVVVAWRVAILIEHHKLRHVVKVQLSQIFLKNISFSFCFTKIQHERIPLANRLKML